LTWTMSKPPEPRRGASLHVHHQLVADLGATDERHVGNRRRRLCSPLTSALSPEPVSARAPRPPARSRILLSSAPRGTGVEDMARRSFSIEARTLSLGGASVSRRLAGIRGVIRPYPLDAHVHVALTFGELASSWARSISFAATACPCARPPSGRPSPHAADPPWRMQHRAAVARSRDPRSRSVGERRRILAARAVRVIAGALCVLARAGSLQGGGR